MLLDETGKNLGEVDSRVAINKAKEKSLDLILVNRSTTPPVCKIGNLGKMKYEQEKQRKENKKREQELKTLKIRPGTHKHDLDIEARKAKEFLLRGDKVKLECRFRNREVVHSHLGRENLEYIISQIKDFCSIEKQCELVVKSMTVVLSPK